MGGGEAVEGAVDWFFKEMEVAYYGEGTGAGGGFFWWGVGF